MRRGGWTAYTPTPVLISMQNVLPMPSAAYTELSRRQDLMGEHQTQRLLRLAVENLGDDDRAWNADWAVGVLRHGSDRSVPFLEAALDSTDWQRRQIAAWLLQGLSRGESVRATSLYVPSDRLFEVLVEGLRDDELPYDHRRKRETWIANGMDAFEFLLRHPARAAPFLPAAIASADEQQAFLAAAVVGLSKQTDLAPIATLVLIANLRADTTPGNARMALPALLGLGETAKVALEAAVPLDGQQAMLIDLALRLIDGGGINDADRLTIRAMTDLYNDPVTMLINPTRLRAGMFR